MFAVPALRSVCLSRHKKRKWCHFVRGTDEAPAALAKRSEAAGLPKDRAAIAFVLALPSDCGLAKENDAKDALQVRVVSDSIALPDGLKGRYGCSRWGAVLLTGRLKGIRSGSLVNIKIDESKKAALPKDNKTGFLTIALD